MSAPAPPAPAAALRVRPGTAEDVPALMDIVRAVVPAMNAAGNFQWQGDYPNAEVLLDDVAAAQLFVAEGADEGGAVRLAGLAAITTAPEPEYARCAGWADAAAPAVVVHRLAAAPAWRGRGVAAALFARADAVAAERGLRFVRCDTNDQNAAMRAILPRLGFRFVGNIPLDKRPGLTFMCYEKEVGRPA